MRLLILFCLFISTSVLAQKNYSESIPEGDSKIYTLESQNINDFKNVDWESVRENFKEKEESEPISLYFKYNKPLTVGKSKVESFKFRYNGQVKDLDSLFELSEKNIERLSGISDQKF